MGGIAGGVSYFLWDRAYSGKCHITHHNNDKVESTDITLDEDSIIIRYPTLANVVEKVKGHKEKNISGIVSGQSPFGFHTNDIDQASMFKTEEYNIKLVASLGREGWVSKEDISAGKQFIDKYSVIISKAMSGGCKSGSDGKLMVLTKPSIIGPNEICTQSYLLVGASDNSQIIENIKSYLCTKFVRALMLSTLASISLSRDTFRYVPYLDFSQSWTDEMLYKKYNLTQEEIDYIERTIKQMK